MDEQLKITRHFKKVPNKYLMKIDTMEEEENF